jgi:hypothetical protein
MSSEDFKFSFKPRLMGPPHEYSLSRESLDWTIGPRSGRVGYPMIKRIRLGYKPTNMAGSRFMAEVWPLNAPKLLMYSVSAHSLIDTADFGSDYARFIRELHKRVGAANPDCVFEAGFPWWRWWPSTIVGVLTALAVAYVLVHGLIGGAYLLAGIVAVTGTWFLWQIWNIVLRNRPRRYDFKHLPKDVLPAA